MHYPKIFVKCPLISEADDSDPERGRKPNFHLLFFHSFLFLQFKILSSVRKTLEIIYTNISSHYLYIEVES